MMMMEMVSDGCWLVCRWASLADDHALQARKFVMDFLVKSFAGLERFLQAKAALVLVGKWLGLNIYPLCFVFLIKQT